MWPGLLKSLRLIKHKWRHKSKEHNHGKDCNMTKIEYLLYAVIVAVLLGPGAAASLFAKIFNL